VTPHVLLVDDDAEMCRLVADRLARGGTHVTWCTAPSEAIAHLAGDAVDVLVTDLRMPEMSGLALAERVAANHPDVPVIVITAFGDLDAAISAIRSGAYDFLNKPFEIEELELRVRRAHQHRRLRAEVRRLREVVDATAGFGELVGESAPMQRLRATLARFAPSDATVLLTGETGTGKELVARALHAQSPRRDGPFVPVDCGAIPKELIESEFFGHARGAFTDARAARKGLFAEADGGTLFLDEVGELPLDLQPKLLRVLQERAVRPIGANREERLDVRVVAATNRDLEALVEEGRFRRDLFFRLEVLRVPLPPLRERGRDVLLLAQHFLRRAAERAGKHVAGLSGPAAERLLEYAWPGNVRELEHCMERAVALASYSEVMVDDLPERIRSYHGEHWIVTGAGPDELVPMEEIERRYILRVLDAVGGSKTRAARILGLDRKTLYRKLERYAARRD
jgi:two-component system response regulator HydG